MSSGIKLILDKDEYKFNTSVGVYETLSGSESDRYQYNFPSYNFSTDFVNNIFDGSFGFSSSGSNVLDKTNRLKTTVNNNLNFSSLDYFTNFGIKNDYDIYFKNINTIAKNHEVYKSSPQSQFMSIFQARSSFPLEKVTEKYEEIISPTLAFRINPGHMKNLNNRNVNVDNIFSLNRLGIDEAFEEGKSLTLGINYRKNKKIDQIEIPAFSNY